MRLCSPRKAVLLPEVCISETELRRMIRTGEAPGFYHGSTGKNFLVDVDGLLEVLAEKCKSNIDAGEQKGA